MISITRARDVAPAIAPSRAPAADAARSPGAYRAARRTAWNLAKRLVASTGCGLNWLFGSHARGRCGILMYHRVANDVAGVPRSTWNVEPARFRAQLAGLIDRGYQARSLRQLIEDGRDAAAPLAKTFAVTFDDAHESVYLHAWPVLQELAIPATIFLSTAYLDSDRPFPFDDWSAAGSDAAPADTWRPLSTRQCREMAAGGLVDLGAHTHTHQDFCGRPEDFASDLACNIEELRSRFGVEQPLFSFPYGQATVRMMSAVRDAGLACALMDCGDLVDPRDPPFGWGRIHVERWDSAATLAAKLSGWYGCVDNVQRRLGAGRRPECIY